MPMNSSKSFVTNLTMVSHSDNHNDHNDHNEQMRIPIMLKERRVRIVSDTDPMDPREWDCAGRMICWHHRYNLGDEHDYDRDDFMRELAFEADPSLEEVVNALEAGSDAWSNWNCSSKSGGNVNMVIGVIVDNLIESAVSDGYFIFPIFLMDHSGISMCTKSFGCRWDSGQVGYIICDNETIDREFNGDRELAEKHLESEVSVYNDYVSGDVYGFIVEEREGDNDWEHVDSCYGFYGSDVRTNGMSEHLDDDLVELAACAYIEY